MKYPLILTPVLGLFVVLSSTLVSPVSARIGESRAQIEGRLLGSGAAIYREEQIRNSRRGRGMPYQKYMDYIENSSELRVYFKTADGRKPLQSDLEEREMGDGWDVHVLYVGGKSVLEVYKRSTAINQYELNALLSRQAGGAYWLSEDELDKRRQGADGVEKEDPPSAFGLEMMRSDGAVRAKKFDGDVILFVASSFDEELAGVHQSSLQGRAPTSVNGF